MPTPALYDTLQSFKDIHKVVLKLADGLTDEQLNWKPEGYSTSIGFHLWHLARESDYLKAANLPIPKKDELLGYLRNSYNAIEEFVELFDTKYSDFENVDEELRKKIERVRLNLLVFLTHDCRHLGMMECLKGLQTGFGSATEQR
ncbi:MAG: DinB family protein [Anaerolineae bacterium]|nr:DinB family protein [Anaerolineae bacterium]